MLIGNAHKGAYMIHLEYNAYIYSKDIDCDITIQMHIFMQ